MAKIEKTWKFGDVSYDTDFALGTSADRVIETVGIINGKPFEGIANNRYFELGYYNGDAKKKPIINISTALGCDVGCGHCDLVEAGPQLAPEDMLRQVDAMVTMVQEIDGIDLREKPFKVNFAKTGEPVHNRNMPQAMRLIADKYPGVSFKYSTSMPNSRNAVQRIRDIAEFAAQYKEGTVQLTISLLSTDEAHRLNSAKPGRLADFKKIREAIDEWHRINPTSRNPEARTPNCSLVIGEETPCDPKDVQDLFPPNLVRFRIRPIIPNTHSQESNIEKVSDARIQTIKQNFEAAGYPISDAGIPTPTEVAFGLASNVMWRRVKEGQSIPKGVIDDSETLHRLGMRWAERNPKDRGDQNQATAVTR